MTRFVLIGAFLLCACGQQPEQSERGATPSASSASLEQGAAAALPDYLPDYPNSTRVEIPNLGVAGIDSRSGNAIAMETDDTPEQAAQFYRARFAAAGVPVRVDTTNAQGGLMGVGRDGEVGAMLTITAGAGKTRIAIIRAAGGR